MSAETRRKLIDQVDALPDQPGVYLFKDASGEVVYVGKAKALRTRVRSYFQQGSIDRVVVRFIDERAADCEVIVTRSEREALLLENNLIKQHKPRYNIRLRDDKSFLHLRIDRSHRFPAIVPMRRPRKDGALYFGPYSSARAIRTTLRLVRGLFPLRDCSDHELQNRSRPCLKYQIKLCSAPCVGYVSESQYREDLEDAIRVLRGDTHDLEATLQRQMQEAAHELQFERAAVLRDRIAFLRNSTDAQSVESNQRIDRDVFGWQRRGEWIQIAVLQFRAGKLLAQESFGFETDLPEDEALSGFLAQYYQSGRAAPDEVVLPRLIEGSEVLTEWLAEKRGRKVLLRLARSGDLARAMVMAEQNAGLALQSETEQTQLSRHILEDLRAALALRQLPRVIECIDVSHLQGTLTVAALVRFVDGEVERAGYRRYRLKIANDDPRAISEVVTRRFRPPAQDLPDLLLIDGGRLQVAAAQSALEAAGVVIDVAGMVKAERRGQGILLRSGEEERVLLADGNEVPLAPATEICFLLQRVRDEAHRFAIAFHRKVRIKAATQGILDAVEGLGRRRAQRLLSYMGGLRELKAASVEQLAGAPGIGEILAARIYATLHGGGS